MIHIKDICYALIFINGQEVGNAPGFLKRLLCIEGNGQFVPSFQLDFLDADSKFFSNRALTDGDIISFYIAKTEDQLETSIRRFLKIESDESYKEMPNSSIAGILDVPKYILEKGSESINGTSEDALKQIAKECELSYSGLYDYNGITPNDKQVWRNSSNRRAVFARNIVDHAYLGDKTCPNLVVNSHRELLFRDLNVLIKTPIEEIKFLISHNVASDLYKDKITYYPRQVQAWSNSGIMGAWQNYGTTRIQRSLSGETKIFKVMDVSPPGKYLALNQELRQTVGNVRFDFAPIDCGNNHENYEKAKFQNIKANALFSEYLSVLIYECTLIELYDVVLYRQQDVNPEVQLKATDVYICVGKRIVLYKHHYAEVIDLAKMSLNVKDENTTLATAMENRKPVIPTPIFNIGGTNTLPDVVKNAVDSLQSINKFIEDFSSQSVLDSIQNITGIDLSKPVECLDYAIQLKNCVLNLRNTYAAIKNTKDIIINSLKISPNQMIKLNLVDMLKNAISGQSLYQQINNALTQNLNNITHLPEYARALVSIDSALNNTYTLITRDYNNIVSNLTNIPLIKANKQNQTNITPYLLNKNGSEDELMAKIDQSITNGTFLSDDAFKLPVFDDSYTMAAVQFERLSNYLNS